MTISTWSLALWPNSLTTRNRFACLVEAVAQRSKLRAELQCSIEGRIARYGGLHESQGPAVKDRAAAPSPASREHEAAKTCSCIRRYGEQAMIVIAVERELALTIEHDVIVNRDLRFGHERRWSTTREPVKPTARCDGIANTEFRAREGGAHVNGRLIEI